MDRIIPTIGRRAVSELTKIFPAKTLRDISFEIGVDPSTLSHWWYDGNNPTSKTLATLAEYGVDVKYVITGKREERKTNATWLENDIPLDDEGVYHRTTFECSCCGEEWLCRYKYCPNCGAKMQKEN